MKPISSDDATRQDSSLEERFGLCQWFHFEDDRLLQAAVTALEELGVRHLRTGVSWADYHRPGGREWYDRQMDVLSNTDLDVLLSVWHTPPSISLDPERGSSAVPPVRPRDYADFVDRLITEYGSAFNALELWNEPNNPYKWDRRHDPDYGVFARMVIDAGNWARECGKTTVLGGLTLLDYDFVAAMEGHGVLGFVDVLGIHAFPGMWEPHATAWDHPSHWYGWEHRIRELERASGLPVWVTETGLATYDKGTGLRGREDRQEVRLREAMEAPAERVYWYSLFDLPPDRVAIEEANGGPREEAEYHMGLIRFRQGFPVRGQQKQAYHALRRALAAPAVPTA